VRRSYKFLMRPTSQQAGRLGAMLEDHRQLYNAALEHRKGAHAKAGVTIGYGEQSADMKHIRRADPDGQGRWSFCSQQATLRRLDKAFAAFFRRVRAGQKPGYPRFKGCGWFDTVDWPKDGDGCRWDAQPGGGQVRVRLQGVGQVKVRQHRPVAGTADNPGTNVAAKSGLNKSILDAGWGVFLSVLRAKAESAGRLIVEVDARCTSQRCARCGHTAAANRISQAAFRCLACGHRAHADQNAAQNILRAGLALQAAQAA
jgi:transposase